MAGTAKHLLWLLAACLPLAGCATGFERFQNDQAKTRAEFRHVRTQEQERANYAACVDQGAMPGSAENLACQLEMEKKARAGDKPQNSANNP